MSSSSTSHVDAPKGKSRETPKSAIKQPQGVDFFDTIRDIPAPSAKSTPPAPGTRKSIWDWVPESLKPTFTVIHKVDDASLTLLDKVASIPDQVRNLVPERLREYMGSVADSVNDAVNLEKLPESLTKFVCLICDVLVLSMSSDPSIWVVMQPRMLIQYGFLTTGLLDGLAMLVKQFTKRAFAPVDQGEGDDPTTPSDSSVMSILENGVSALFSTLHYYTVGMLPASIPKETIKGIIVANAALSLMKNIEHFGPYLMNLVKSCLNAIWRFITKRDFFDAEQNESIMALSTLCAELDVAIADINANRISAAQLRSVITTGTTALASAVARGVNKDICAHAKEALLRATAHLALVTTSAQYTDPRPVPVMVQIIGETAVGKTTVTNYVMAAIAKACHYKGELSSMKMVYQKGTNFQASKPANLKFLVFDDSLLISSAQDQAEYLKIIGDLGSSIPLLMDSPIAEKKGTEYLDPEFVFSTDNKLPHQLPITTEGAVGRRFNGGIHRQTVTAAYALPNGALNVQKLTEAEDIQIALDEAILFTDHEGVVRTFTEFVSALVNLRNRNIAQARNNTASQTALASSFKLNEAAEVSNPPTTFKGTAVTNKIPQWSTVAPADKAEVSPTKAADQALKVFGAPEGFAQWLHNPDFTVEENAQLLSRTKRFLGAAAQNFVFKDGVLTCDGKNVLPENLWSSFVPSEKAPKTEVHVPVWDLTVPVVNAIREDSFVVKDDCCRHQGYCFTHGNKFCASWDEDAYRGNFPAFAHWAIAQPMLPDSLKGYLGTVAAAYSPLDGSPFLKGLKLALEAFAYAGIGWTVGMVLTRLYLAYYGNFATSQAAYGTHGAKLSKRTDDVKIAAPTFGVPQPKDQGATALERPTSWILEKLQENVVPVTTSSGTKKMDLNMLRIAGNLAVMNRHAFAAGFDTILLGGLIAQALPVVRVSKIADLREGPFVQIIPDPRVDIVMAVLPKSLRPCKNILNKLISGETALTQLSGLIMAKRRLYTVEAKDGKIVPEPLPELSEFPLGDVSSMRSYESGAKYQGLYAKTAVPTVSGMCGFPVFTTNTRVGRGSSIIVGIHAAFAEPSEAIIAPLTQESVQAFIDACPPGVLNMVSAQSRPAVLLPVAHDPPAPNITLVGELPDSDRQYQNTRNTIRRAPDVVADCLVGLEITHPVSGERMAVPAINVCPAPVRDLISPLAKVQMHNHVPDLYTYEMYKQAMLQTEAQINKFADPKLTEPQTSLFTLEEAINGCPELGILGLDMKKSPGYMPGVKPGHLGRSEYAEETRPGYWTLKSKHLPALEEIVKNIKKGKLPNAFVVVNGKVELRPEGKPARITSCYAFLVLVAIRMFSMHLPAMLITGRGRNGMSFGADLNANDGREAAEATKAHDYVTSADAKNYDASKSSYFAHPSECVAGRAIRARFPFLSLEASLIPAMLSRIVYVVFGSLVWTMWHSMQSGHPLTTYLNCLDSSTTGRTAYILSNPPAALQFDTEVFSQAYGDDFRAAHSHPGFTAKALVDTGAKLGITYTPVSKTGAFESDFVSGISDVHLKRHPWQDVCGFYHYPLQIETVSHIHAFYHGKDRDRAAAIAQNAESALREWFHYGRTTFDEVRARMNRALILEGIRPCNLTYDDLFATWYSGQGATRITEFKGYVTLQSALNDTAGKASAPSIIESSATMKDTVTMSKINPASQTQVSSTSGVVSQHKLTKYVDNNALSASLPTPAAAKSGYSPLNPYPAQGIESVLSREYPVASFDWNTADPAGTNKATIKFPEVMFSIPNISEKLSTFRYLRSAVRVTIRVNGNAFVGGALMAAVLPYHNPGSDEDWRSDHNLLMNSPNWLISAAKSEAVQFTIPWSSPNTFYDLQNSSPAGAIGTLFINVAAAQYWMSASPPSSLSVQVFAQLVTIQVAGNDTNSGPTGSKLTLAQALQRTANQYKGKVVLQSAVSEASDKASSGSLESFTQALSTVPAILGSVEKIAPLLVALDKPVSVAAVTPIRITSGADTIHTEGVSDGVVMAAPISAYVSIDNQMVAEANPKPKWGDVIGLPGVVGYFTFKPSMAAGDILFNLPVNPSHCYDISGTGVGPYVPTPLALCAMHHRYWRGDMKYGIRFFGPSSQKGTIRVTFIPSNTSVAAIPDDVVGDVETAVYDIVGDTDVYFTTRYVSKNAQLVVTSPNFANTLLTALGRISVQVVSPLSSQVSPSSADVSAIVYQAAAPGFILSTPQNLPAGWSLETNPAAVSLSQAISSDAPYAGHAVAQASVRDSFGMDFPSLSPSKSVNHSGVCNPDQTGGPTDLFRRYVEVGGSSLPFLFSAEPRGPLHKFAAAWKSWSGGINYKFVPKTGDATGLIMVERVEFISDGAIGYSGTTFQNSSQDPIVTVTLPFSQPNPTNPFYNNYAESKDYLFYRLSSVAGGSDSYRIYQSVGDDFCLYHFIAPMYLKYTASSSSAKGKEASRTTPARR